MAGPHLSATGAKRKGRRRCWAGGEGKLGHLGRLRARGKRKGLRAEAGPAGEMRERGKKRVSFFLFKISFQIHFSNIQTSNKQKSMHSNHDAQTLIISKLI
jgi:hypothetical protein